MALSDELAPLDPAMIIVTCAADGEQDGCLVGFHAQCGMSPLRYAVWLSRMNRTFRVAHAATHLGVHLLDETDHELAELFGGTTGDDVDKFARCAWAPGAMGVPMLTDCAHRFVIEKLAMLDVGSDHELVVGAPIESSLVAEGSLRPLRLHAAVDIPAGHPAE
jgi:flavin reductase (DIM6/NTAB) family NADH-FMN oxidoreductase RutF